MQPVSVAGHIKACLVVVDYRGRSHSLLELLLEVDQAFDTPLAHDVDGTLTDSTLKQVGQQLARPLKGQQLVTR